MSDSTTVARPYAKAVFEFARDKKTLASWSGMLGMLSEAMRLEAVSSFISNPSSEESQRVDLLMSVLKSGFTDGDTSAAENLLRLLSHNKRLSILPEIKSQFEAQKAAFEKTIKVDVVAYSHLSESQLLKLGDSLTKRLERTVTLNQTIDPSLLGGAIIRAGDLVIDGSVRDKLNKLSADLIA